MTARATCLQCNDQGHVIWIYPERKPRPAYWFTRGKDGERPIECDCMKAMDAKE